MNLTPSKVKIDIITCPQWGARPPKEPPVLCSMSERFIIHGTDGHHPELDHNPVESTEEAMAYARSIQDFHMGPQRGWNDSGQNFTVCRNGMILQGRWMTVTAIQARHMVISAHCPGQNDQVGIEFEHLGIEPMTGPQLSSGARLMAWVSSLYGKKICMPADPHKKYYNTGCPVNLVASIPHLISEATYIMKGV